MLMSCLHLEVGTEEIGQMVVFGTLIFTLRHTIMFFAKWIDDMACDVEKIMGASRTHFVKKFHTNRGSS